MGIRRSGWLQKGTVKLAMRFALEYARRPGRFQRNARLYLVNNALSGVTAGIVLVLYNLYLYSLGYAADFVGFVLFAVTIGAGIAIFPAGICVDRFSGKVILIGSNLLIALAGIGQFLFRQPIPLLISGFVEGVAFAFILVINAPFLTRNSSPRERPDLFSMNISLGLITLVAGEVLGGVLPIWFRSLHWLMAPLPAWAAPMLASQSDPRSYQLSLLFAGLIAAPSLIPLFMLRDIQPPDVNGGLSMVRVLPVNAERTRAAQAPLPIIRASPAPTERGREGVEGEREGREDVAGEGERTRAAQAPPPIIRASPAPTEGERTWDAMEGEGEGTRATIGRMKVLLRSPFFFLMLVYVLTGLGAGLFIPYFNIFFVHHLRASSALFGVIDGGANGLTALTTLAAPWLAARIGRVNTIALTRLLSIPLLLIVGLTGILPLAALLYPLRQGMMDMSNGVLQVYSMEVVSGKYRGLANSSYQAAFQVPWAITASLGGIVIVQFGYAPIFLLGAACYMLAIAILWGRFRYTKGNIPGQV
jgi:MFS family permease